MTILYDYFMTIIKYDYFMTIQRSERVFQNALNKNNIWQ